MTGRGNKHIIITFLVGTDLNQTVDGDVVAMELHTVGMWIGGEERQGVGD